MLELESTDNLITELESRFDNLIVVGLKDMDGRNAGRLMRWKCVDLYVGIGLLHVMIHRLTQRLIKRARPGIAFENPLHRRHAHRP